MNSEDHGSGKLYFYLVTMHANMSVIFMVWLCNYYPSTAKTHESKYNILSQQMCLHGPKKDFIMDKRNIVDEFIYSVTNESWHNLNKTLNKKLRHLVNF